MNKFTACFGILTLVGGVILSSCTKDDDTCKVCHYTEADGSTVSMGELCGSEYKNAESTGFPTSSGVRPVTCN